MISLSLPHQNRYPLSRLRPRIWWSVREHQFESYATGSAQSGRQGLTTATAFARYRSAGRMSAGYLISSALTLKIDRLYT